MRKPDFIRQVADTFRSQSKLKAMSNGSMRWFRKMAYEKGGDESELTSMKSRHVKTMSLGKMYFFAYDPKTKKQLPYYDRFPLILPFKVTGKGFMGLNLHYIPPMERAKILSKLVEFATDKRYDEKTRMILSYDLLNLAAKKYAPLKPCVKQYLYGHVRSRFVRIDFDEFMYAVFLPVENFAKQNKTAVWKESLKQI